MHFEVLLIAAFINSVVAILMLCYVKKLNVSCIFTFCAICRVDSWILKFLHVEYRLHDELLLWNIFLVMQFVCYVYLVNLETEIKC